MIEPHLTVDDLAELLHTTPAGIHAMRYRGKGPRATRAGKGLLFAESEVKRWLGEQTERPLRVVGSRAG